MGEMMVEEKKQEEATWVKTEEIEIEQKAVYGKTLFMKEKQISEEKNEKTNERAWND